MAGSHITEQHTFKFLGSVQPELLNMTSYEPQADDSPQNYELDSLDNFKDWNILLKVNDVMNNGANKPAIDILNQEHQDQDYYNQRDQQYIGRKYNGGLEQITLELVPNTILEEEEDGFHQWADQYDQWDNTSYTPMEEDDVGGFHTFNVDNRVFNITKIKPDGTSKTGAVSELSESSNKLDLYIGERQS